MASLRSMILDHKMGIICRREDVDSQEKFQAEFAIMERDRNNLKSIETILVNGQKVYNDLVDINPKGMVDLREIPFPKPPHKKMWLEAARLDNARRFGVMVYRGGTAEMKRWYADYEFTSNSKLCEICESATTIPETTFVRADCWEEHEDHGGAMYLGDFIYWLNAAGNLEHSHVILADIDEEQSEDIHQVLANLQCWTLHCFARMNCHNVKLVPMTAGAPKLKKGKPHALYSYWHEIVVTNLPELRKQQKQEAKPDGDKREIRFHKVRGHYADYTKGNGLFGKWKVRIWVEEHTAGEQELGTVISSYAIQ